MELDISPIGVITIQGLHSKSDDPAHESTLNEAVDLSVKLSVPLEGPQLSVLISDNKTRKALADQNTRHVIVTFEPYGHHLTVTQHFSKGALKGDCGSRLGRECDNETHINFCHDCSSPSSVRGRTVTLQDSRFRGF